VRKLLIPVKSASDDVITDLDSSYPKAQFVLAVLDDDAEAAHRWLAAYDALLPVEPGAAYRRVHLVTLVFWLIARDRYAMVLPTECLPGLPDSLRGGPDSNRRAP